jgi:UDP-N-acetylglucosamine 2-epimerase (non-hydrolysing)
MLQNQTLFDIAASALVSVGSVIEGEEPDLVLVQGDTSSTFVGALASYYHRIPVAHVEAGLRTHERYAPFPEEIHRTLTSRIAHLHFAPTSRNRDELLREGVAPESIFVTGNTVIDALLWVTEKVCSSDGSYTELKAVDFSKLVVLVTGHRRENFGDRFAQICNALKTVAVTHKNVQLVYAVHPNPNVTGIVHRALGDLSNVVLIKPLDYEPFVYLMNKCLLIISDSGGIQEEAPSLGKPVLVTRDTTERPEAVEAGTVRLVGADEHRIVAEVNRLLSDKSYYRTMAGVANPYGDGRASQRITEQLLGYLDA